MIHKYMTALLAFALLTGIPSLALADGDFGRSELHQVHGKHKAKGHHKTHHNKTPDQDDDGDADDATVPPPPPPPPPILTDPTGAPPPPPPPPPPAPILSM